MAQNKRYLLLKIAIPSEIFRLIVIFSSLINIELLFVGGVKNKLKLRLLFGERYFYALLFYACLFGSSERS